MTTTTEQEKLILPSSLPRLIRLFCGPRGERVEEMTLCDGTTGNPLTAQDRTDRKISEPLVRYVGIVPMVNNIPTPYGMVQIPTDTRFRIEAGSPGEALDCYPARVEEISQALQQRQKEEMEEAQRQSLVPTAEEVQALKNENLKLIRP